MRNNKGITLIALVITIIVLLILAGVSIAMLTGDNGILTQATSARDDTKNAELADKINMALNGELANLLADGKLSGDAAAIATANGITQGNTAEDGDFKIIVADDLTPDAKEPVLTITSNESPSVTGNITYTPGTSGAAGKYSVVKANYPGESTTNSTNET